MNPNQPSPEHAVAIIDRILYLTLATVCTDGRPWNSPVFFARDKHFNLFWGSHVDSQHSKNLGVGGPVFIVIYDSTVPAGQGEGVYIEAQARKLTDPTQIARAHHLIDSRHQVPYWKLEELDGNTPIRLYQAAPTRFWMNDESERDGHYIDTRSEIQLRNSAPPTT